MKRDHYCSNGCLGHSPFPLIKLLVFSSLFVTMIITGCKKQVKEPEDTVSPIQQGGDATMGSMLKKDARFLEQSSDPGAKATAVAAVMTPGIDVSHWQGAINWTSVRNGGKRFAFARVSDGTGTIDSRFAANWPTMKTAGVVRGAYQFFRPTQSASAQANLFLQRMGTLDNADLPPVIDVEVTDGASGEAIVLAVKAWLDIVRAATGRIPIVYTGRYFWNALPNPSRVGPVYLWIAHWNVGSPTIPAMWNEWKFWQHTDQGSVPGISGNVDLNWFNGDFPGLQSFALASNKRRAICDFNGDGKTDPSFFNVNTGYWKVRGLTDVLYGNAGDLGVPADYNGDGKTEMCIWRLENGHYSWYTYGQTTPYVYGDPGDIPVPADYTGDGKADKAILRLENNHYTWYVPGQDPYVYGNNGDIPVPADYDGDGKADKAIIRVENGHFTWYSPGQNPFVYGDAGDIPVPADYDGDGKADRAMFRPSTGAWFTKPGEEGLIYGQAGDIPAPGDYNGDGKAEPSVYRAGSWFIYGQPGFAFGNIASGDKLLVLPYHIRNRFFP
jgi:GH25 family lysozyme M1 (1,4-beta-N-acetylmuramidase)